MFEYIAGYTVSNDLSCRMWQRDPKYAGNVPQWCFSKGYDGFAPIGPMICSPRVLGAANKQTLKTMVNAEIRQDSNTSDLLFGVLRIVSFLSQGTTLKKGSLIMTGTPSKYLIITYSVITIAYFLCLSRWRCPRYEARANLVKRWGRS